MGMPGCMSDSVIAFRASDAGDSGLEVRANFGVFTGREATPAELEELGHQLLPEVAEVTVVAEQRHEVGEQAEAALHQVRIEIDEQHVPSDPAERQDLAERIIELAEDWMLLCSAERHAEVAE
jgi:hypothetical protein